MICLLWDEASFWGFFRFKLAVDAGMREAGCVGRECVDTDKVIVHREPFRLVFRAQPDDVLGCNEQAAHAFGSLHIEKERHVRFTAYHVFSFFKHRRSIGLSLAHLQQWHLPASERQRQRKFPEKTCWGEKRCFTKEGSKTCFRQH